MTNKYEGVDLVRIGRRIRHARETKNMTQQQLAEKLGKTPDAISNYEKGQLALRITELPVLTQALDISIEMLFFNETAHEARVIEAFRSIHTLPNERLIFLLRIIENITTTFHKVEDDDDIPPEYDKDEFVLSDELWVYVFSLELIPMPLPFEWPDPEENFQYEAGKKQVAERLRHLEVMVKREFTTFQEWLKHARATMNA